MLNLSKPVRIKGTKTPVRYTGYRHDDGTSVMVDMDNLTSPGPVRMLIADLENVPQEPREFEVSVWERADGTIFSSVRGQHEVVAASRRLGKTTIREGDGLQPAAQELVAETAEVEREVWAVLDNQYGESRAFFGERGAQLWNDRYGGTIYRGTVRLEKVK